MPVRITHFDPDADGLAVFLGPTEAQIMEIIWQHGPVTVKRALFLMSGERKPAYTTAMTILARLTEKGLLNRHKDGRYYVYRAVLDRDEFLQERVQTVFRCLKKNFQSYIR